MISKKSEKQRCGHQKQQHWCVSSGRIASIKVTCIIFGVGNLSRVVHYAAANVPPVNTNYIYRKKERCKIYRKQIFDSNVFKIKYPQYSHLYLTFLHCCWLSEIRLQSVTSSVLLLNGSAQFWSVSELQSQHFTALPIQLETKTRKSQNIQIYYWFTFNLTIVNKIDQNYHTYAKNQNICREHRVNIRTYTI